LAAKTIKLVSSFPRRKKGGTRKGQGDGDWEPTALELSGKLGKANRKIKALQAQVKKLEEQQKLSQEPPPPRL
jgi:hypothetical protein